MRTSMKYMFRKMKNHFGQQLGMGLLILIASLFSPLFSLSRTPMNRRPKITSPAITTQMSRYKVNLKTVILLR